MRPRHFAIAGILVLGLCGPASAGGLATPEPGLDLLAATLHADYAKHGGPHWKGRGRGHHYGWYKHRNRGHHYGWYHQRRHHGWKRRHHR
jgi:hypothetical protein